MAEDNAPTPRESVLGSGAGGPLSAPTPWIQGPGYLYYPRGVVVGAPPGGNKGDGTINVQALYLNGTLLDLSPFFKTSGGTFTGMITLFADPIGAYDAATKRYVDNAIVAVNGNFGNYLPLTGGTLSGSLTISSGALVLNTDPVSNLQAATKQYVDTRLANIIGVPDAPSDGSCYSRNNAAWSNVYDAGTF